MHIFYGDDIFYFVDQYGLAVEDFFSLFHEVKTFKNETSAIRWHLLLMAGMGGE